MGDIDVTKIEKDIETLTQKVWGLQADCVSASDRSDIESLSKFVIALAKANTSLGRQGRYAEYIARNAEHAYKAAREQYKVDAIAGGKSATYGDTQRYIKSTPEHKIWSDALLLADQATDLAYRTDTFLKMVQSRVSLMKNDIR